MWLAAELSSKKGRFTHYAVLGDNVVIADTEVAKTYEQLLDKLGVSISKDKSLVSNEGALEFAKRFMVKRAQKDLSPISLRALLTVRSTLGKNPWMERALLLPFKAHRKKFIKKACTTCEPKDFCTTGLCYLNWILDTRNRAFYRTHHLRGIHYDSTLVAGIFRDRYPSHW